MRYYGICGAKTATGRYRTSHRRIWRVRNPVRWTSAVLNMIVRPRTDRTHMGKRVGRVIFERARHWPHERGSDSGYVSEMQRQAAASLKNTLRRRKGRRGLVLLDMDGTVTLHDFCRRTGQGGGGRMPRLGLLLDGAGGRCNDAERERIASSSDSFIRTPLSAWPVACRDPRGCRRICDRTAPRIHGGPGLATAISWPRKSFAGGSADFAIAHVVNSAKDSRRRLQASIQPFTPEDNPRRRVQVKRARNSFQIHR